MKVGAESFCAEKNIDWSCFPMSVLTCQVCGGTLTVEASGQIQCTLCGVTYTKETLQALLQQRLKAQWDYEATPEGVTLSAYRGENAQVDVPAQLDGKPVTQLGKGVFYHKKKLRQVTLPEGVETVGRMAFCKCIHLEQATLPQTLRRIESDAYTNCHFLQSMDVPDGVTQIGEAAFSGCVHLESLTLPHGLRTLSLLTLYDCRSLRHLRLPDQLEVIQDSALCNCASLTDLTLPETVKRIGSMAFWGCTGLETLRIPAAVQSFGQMPFGPPGGQQPLLLVEPDSYAAQWAQEQHWPHRILPADVEAKI